MIRILGKILLASAFFWSDLGAVSAQDYPSRKVSMIIPFSPGGSNDIIGRYLAEGLTKAWGQNVIIENKPGAGSVIGTRHVATANPDGSTLLFVSSSYTANAAAKADLPYDALKDLKLVGFGAIGEMVIVAGPRVKATSLADLFKQARNQPMFYGTAGLGGTGHFATELLNEVGGVKMDPVHYKGGSDALMDVAGGRVDLYLGTVTQVLPFVENKRVIPLAVTSKARAKLMPDVPTVAEAGFPSAQSDIWWGVFAPAAVPHNIALKIHSSVETVMNSNEATDFLTKQGATPMKVAFEKLPALVEKELQKWKAVAVKNNISLK